MIKSGNIIKIDNAKIKYKNFSGVSRSNMDREGDRKFTLVIPVRDEEDERIIQEMVDEGYYISLKPPVEEGGVPEYHVTCHLGNFSPQIYKHVGDNVFTLSDETIPILDRDQVISVDLGLKGSQNRMAKNGMVMYVEVMHVYVAENILSDMYM